MHLRGLAAAAIACALLGGCAGYAPVAPAFHEVLTQPYRLDAGDKVRITVFEQDSLTNTYDVDQAGFVSMPLVGSVPARGKTTKQLAGMITTKLRDGFLRDPDVSVEVSQYRPFFIMGEVGTAGQYSYVPGMTAQNAIAIAGGFTPRADQETVDITREVNGHILTGRVLISDPLLPGDTIYVRERLF